MHHRSLRAFTIIELLVVVSIIALLIGILLPAIGKAREQAKVTQSQANLRNMSIAHAAYAAAFNDRQITMIVDSITSYGANATAALQAWAAEYGQPHPIIPAGYGPEQDGSGQRIWAYRPGHGAGHDWCPEYITFNYQGSVVDGFGLFRMGHQQSLFTAFLNGRYYDPVLWAPKDELPLEYASPAFDSPFEFTPTSFTNGVQVWSTYCLSPAAMYSSDVLANPERGGYKNPWTLGAGTRTPPMSRALYPDLKTHMLEHHWLQNRRADCNPGFVPGTYGNCEPYYFNHSFESNPVTLFYDGHVDNLGVKEAELADSRQLQQESYGLWSRDTPYGMDGYFIQYGYDNASTSFHILTTDGIRGRDKLAN